MSSFSTVEVYSINDANFWYVETGDLPTPDAWAIGPDGLPFHDPVRSGLPTILELSGFVLQDGVFWIPLGVV
jgi:hypothetical protein